MGFTFTFTAYENRRDSIAFFTCFSKDSDYIRCWIGQFKEVFSWYVCSAFLAVVQFHYSTRHITLLKFLS